MLRVAARWCLLSLLAGPALASAAPSISAQVDRTQLQFGQQVKLTLRVTSQGGRPEAMDLQAPDLSAWRVLGRYQYNSYDSRRQTNNTTITLTLQPTSTGHLVIGSFSIQAGGRRIASAPITVKVGGQGPPPAPASQPGQEAAEDRVAFLQWEVPRDEIWVGEQLNATLALYVNREVQVTGFDLGKVDLAGFWNQEDGSRARRRAQLVRKGAYTYVREEVALYRLFPLRAGAGLPAVSAKLDVRRQQLFGRRSGVPMERVAAAHPLQIKPLPTAGRPGNFRGATVGALRLRATVDQQRIQAGQGVQLTVTTHITGLIHSAPAVELPPLTEWQVFPSTSKESTAIANGRVTGTRVQRWLLRPRKAGHLKIPALAISTFVPQRGAYQTVRSAPIRVAVTGEIAAGAAQPSAGAGEETGVPALRTIRRAPALGPADPPAHLSLWFWAILLGAPLGFVGLLISDSVRARRDATAGGRAARRAAAVAHKALDAVGRAAQPKEAYAAVSAALMDYLEARTQQTLRGLTHPQLVGTLSARGVGERTLGELVAELENCDFARFAPAAAGGSAAQSAQRAKRLVDRVDAEVRA